VLGAGIPVNGVRAKAHKPYEWLQNPTTTRFIEALLKGGKIPPLKTMVGRYGGTYAHTVTASPLADCFRICTVSES
jgi:hypothetical protein